MSIDHDYALVGLAWEAIVKRKKQPISKLEELLYDERATIRRKVS